MSRDPVPSRLVFTPRAWLKWQFLCHAGPTEVGAFGLSDEKDPLLVEDLLVVQQATTVVSVSFEDTAVADLFDAMADVGIPPHRFARVWLHTHPGASVTPSHVDEETFRRAFGGCDWAVMGILGRTGRTYSRIQFHAGPGGAMEIPVGVAWSLWPDYAMTQRFFDDLDLWQTEVVQLIRQARVFPESAKTDSPTPHPVVADYDPWFRGDVDPFLTSSLHDFE